MTDHTPPPGLDPGLAELLPIAVGLVDATGTVVWGNHEFREQIGWDPEQRPDLHFTDIIDLDGVAWGTELQHRLTSGEVQSALSQVRFRPLSGERFVADLDIRRIEYGPDRQLGLLATVQPTSPDRYDDDPVRRALQLQPELVCEWLPDGTIVYTNRAYDRYFGFEESVVGRNLNELDDWEEGTSPMDTLDYFETGRPARSLERHYDGGLTVEWTNSLVRSKTGEVISILAVGRDVTDQVRTRELLRHNEERFRMMVTHIWDTILLLDANGNLLDATMELRADLGYPTEFWQGVNLLDVVHPDDQPIAISALSDLVTRGPGAEAWAEMRVIRADGSNTWLELNGANLLHEPSVQALIITVRNIDNRKLIESQLAARREEAEARLHERERFVAQVSHELRNPLHGMIGLSEVLQHSTSDPALAEAAAALHRQSMVMRRIVDDLLDVAQLEVGQLRVREAVVDLVPIINDSITLARDSASVGVELRASAIEPAHRYVKGDDDRIRQAVANLLSNACKHTRAGEISVEIGAGHEPNTTRITVLDTGSGISADDTERLFEPYQRGRGNDRPGVGLGLAIVKGTVEAMGGSVGAAPRIGGGSEFWIEVDDAQGRPAEPAATAADTPPGSFSHLRVLVVDDDPVNQLLASLQAKALSATVTTASSGEEAWALLQTESFDVALIDVQMPPGMSGLELVRMVRAGIANPPLLAVMTASATLADREGAADAGADEYVAKPATASDIAAVLRQRS
ncbi:MAG: hypothetical protein RLZ14_696 [Actinomycetota bacterium]